MILEERFWSKVDKSGGEDACWNWIASRNDDGYGKIRVSEKILTAHRVAWKLNNGSIPEKMCILHTCDNPSCVNIKHLFLGTRSDNMQDMINKKRDGCYTRPEAFFDGARTEGAKLNKDQILDIRKRYVYRTNSTKILAKEYGVCEEQIWNIATKKCWSWL